MTVKEKSLQHYLAQPVTDELIDIIKQFDDKQLLWLSGYCQGLAEFAASKPPSSQVNSQLKILILYASQTGNAQAIAEQLHQELAFTESELSSTLDFKIKNLANYQLLIVVASTHGEGEPPDDGIDFYEQVRGNKAPKLTGIKHAVLGLGDSSYEYFCQTAKDLDEAILSLGSTSFQARLDCDVDYQSAANDWLESIVEKVKQLNNVEPTTATSFVHSKIKQVQKYDKSNPYPAKVLQLQKITSDGSIKNTYHLEFDISDSAIDYQVGDALAVLAYNSESSVVDILEQLEGDADTVVSYQDKSTTIKQLLIESLEITLLNKPLLNKLFEITGNEILNDTVLSRYADYIKNHQLIDVLKLLEMKLTPQQLVNLLKPIKPRLYSISSSLAEVVDEIHVTVNLVNETNENGVRNGLASHHLTQRLQEGDIVNVYIEPNNNFRLAEPDKPIIMIGAGTGVAPFRAFIQQREAQKATGDSWLFFGNPNFNDDFLYQTEWQKYLQSGLLSKIDLAFSRDQEQKIYVQDKLLENAKLIWEWIEKGAHIYVCGDMNNMAKQVELVLLKIITEQNQCSEESSKQYLKQLKIDKRYQRDVY